MQSGVYWGYVGLIEGLVARIKAEFGGAHDGDRHRRAGAAVRRRDAGASSIVDPDLTMRGPASRSTAATASDDRALTPTVRRTIPTSCCSCRSAGRARSA